MNRPVEGLAPNANAISVTLKMDKPFKPALEMPKRNAAVPARNQEDRLISEMDARIMWLDIASKNTDINPIFKSLPTTQHGYSNT